MLDLRAIAPSALLLGLIVTVMLMLGDGPVDVQISRALDNLLPANNGSIVADLGDDTDRRGWVDPERRHSAIRREASASSGEAD